MSIVRWWAVSRMPGPWSETSSETMVHVFVFPIISAILTSVFILLHTGYAGKRQTTTV